MSHFPNELTTIDTFLLVKIALMFSWRKHFLVTTFKNNEYGKGYVLFFLGYVIFR
jgi:hypothetical protein